MQDWIAPILTVIGSTFASYLGVRLAITRLEVQVIHMDGLVRAHDQSIDNLQKQLAPVVSDIERMKNDIGTHDAGLRGQMHRHTNMITKHELRLHALDKYPLQEM